jgi:hypothetical protein
VLLAHGGFGLDYHFSTALCVEVMMQTAQKITGVWLVLVSLTLLSIFMAEDDPKLVLSITTICFVIAIKGQLVVDKLIGLRHANPTIRKLMLGYFYFLPPLISLSMIFPELIVAIK